MAKKANVKIILVPEASSKSRRNIENEIARSLRCNLLLKVEKVTVYEIHHRMPDGKEVRIHG